MLPYDLNGEENGIAISTCYVEALDVTNIGLFNLPTALGLWVEVEDKDSGTPDKDYMIIYRIGSKFFG